MALISLVDRLVTGSRVRRRDVIRFGALLVLDGCAERPANPPRDQVLVAPGLTLLLPEPASLNRQIEVSQLVVARYRTRTIAFEVRVSAAHDHFDLLCVDTLGREAMRIHWTRDGIVAEKAAWVPENLRPENMLADIVMLYWPEAVVARALAGSGGTLVVEPGMRSIRLRGEEVIHADFQPLPGADPWNGNVRYSNLPRDYALDIQSRLLRS
jgi:hypothetical protein